MHTVVIPLLFLSLSLFFPKTQPVVTANKDDVLKITDISMWCKSRAAFNVEGEA